MSAFDAEAFVKARQEWLSARAARRFDIGASEAAAAIGANPWKSPLALYCEKVGIAEPEPMNDAMKWGLWLEDAIAKAYTQETGEELASPQCIFTNAAEPWMFCTPDRLTQSEKIVELKTAARPDGWGGAGTDEIPAQYLIQVHHQMSCLDAREADVAVLIAGSDFRIYHVSRNDRLLNEIIDREHDFWQRLQRREPPEPDFDHADNLETLRKLYRPDGPTIHLGDAALQLAEAFMNLGEVARTAKAYRDQVEAKLLAAMRDAETAIFPNGLTATRSQRTRKGYTVSPCQYQVLTVKQPK